MPTDDDHAAARAARKQANREAWAADPRNANAQRAEVRAAAIALEAEAAAETGDNRALSKLRRIMADINRPVHQRCEAASAVLLYELSPSSLANVPAGEPVAAASYRFLQAVADDPETPEPLRLKVLRDIAAIENARAARPPDPEKAEETRRLVIAMINGHRRMMLHKKGLSPSRTEWVIRADDVFDMPLDAPASPASATMTIADLLDHARALPVAEQQRQHEARRRRMLGVRIRSRLDPWDEIMAGASRPDPATSS